MSDEKPKNKARPSRFNQNHAFLVIVVVLLATCLALIDTFIGGIGIRQEMLALRTGLTLVIWLGYLLLAAYWMTIKTFYFWLPVLVFGIVGGGILFIVALIYVPVPAQLLPLLLGVVMVIWFYTHERQITLPPSLMPTLVLLTPVFCTVYLVIGDASIPYLTYKDLAVITTNSRQYVLRFEYYLGTEGALEFYECNAYGFACYPIYHGVDDEKPMYHDFYTDGVTYADPCNCMLVFPAPGKPTIDLRHEDNAIRLYVDGEIWFEQRVE